MHIFPYYIKQYTTKKKGLNMSKNNTKFKYPFISIFFLFLIVFVSGCQPSEETAEMVTTTVSLNEKAQIDEKTIDDLIHIDIPKKYEDVEIKETVAMPHIEIIKKLNDVSLRIYIIHAEDDDRNPKEVYFPDIYYEDESVFQGREVVIAGQKSKPFIFTTSDEIKKNDFQHNCIEMQFEKGDYEYTFTMKSKKRALTKEEIEEFCNIMESIEFKK